MKMASRREGVVLLLVIGCLIFTSIIFASMVQRVRHESALTARNSVNEAMYQIASAIGRITMRKLARDFSAMDDSVEDKLIDAIFQGKTFKNKDYTTTIRNLDVVKALLARDEYKHTKGNLAIDKVLCTAEFEAAGFRPEIPGLNIQNDFEKRGNIAVEVTVSYSNYIKKCTIKKPFFVVRLLPTPFWKFTLFASRGASVPQRDVNRLANVGDDGKSDALPLVCFNRLLDDKSPNQADLDFFNVFVDPNTILPSSQALEESGWIYLGGFGQANDNWKDTKNPGNPNCMNNLALNVVAGGNGPFDAGYYGEGFHCYFTNESFGWLCADDYSTAINQLNGADKSVSLAYNDFGFFTGQKTAQFGGKYLFETPGQPGLYSGLQQKYSLDVFDKGSALHLFGTPNLCTPTLLFGKVKRRFMRTWGFLFSAPGFNRVYPIRNINPTDWDNGVLALEIDQWLTNKDPSGNIKLPIENALNNIWPAPVGNGPVDGAAYRNGFPPSFPPLTPSLKDDEPYLACLKNIKHPKGPEKSWQAAFAGFKYIDKGPEALLDSSYSFTNDPELCYSGSISSIRPPADYLRDKVSYEISDPSLPKPLQLSKIPFLTTGSDAILDLSRTPPVMSLHQVIAIDGDLVIDKPFIVAQGGIILVNGEITIKAPIINPFIHGYPTPPTSPHMFGYLTLVSEKGITVELGGAAAGGKLPELHAFLICMNSSGDGRIKTTTPFHLTGGIATDRIDELVKVGGIIEWGFYRNDTSVSKGNFSKQQSFYGLAMGPRDIEVVSED